MAKEAQDEEALSNVLSEDYSVKSTQPNRDYESELMCRWKEVHAVWLRGGGVPRQLIDEAIPTDGISAMRQPLVEEQERKTLQKCNAGLQTIAC